MWNGILFLNQMTNSTTDDAIPDADGANHERTDEGWQDKESRFNQDRSLGNK